MAAMGSMNVKILGKRTSIRLEPQLRAALREAAEHKEITIDDLCSKIAEQKDGGMHISSAVRVFLILFYRNLAMDNGKLKRAA